MKAPMVWIVTAALGVSAAVAMAEEPADALARGKLEADLGHPAVAAEAFASVAHAARATTEERWEALVRLGVARRDAGDTRGSADAFQEAWRSYGKDPEALRFLVQAVGGALPGPERWDRVWRQVDIEVERRDPERPQVRVLWPGIPFGLCPCSGTPVDLDFKDSDLQDVFRLFADVSGLNVVVQPGTQGRVTYRAVKEPWDEVLERLLAPNGLVARLQGNVLWIGPAAEAGEKRGFSGRPTSFEFVDKDLVETLREIAALGEATVEVPEGVGGLVTLKLVEVPWDQAFDLLARVNGLTWARKGDVIRLGLRSQERPR